VGAVGRLGGGRAFEEVFRRGRQVSAAGFALRYARGQRGGHGARVAVVAPKRLGGAVRRNRLRRRMREVVRQGPDVGAGWDLVVVVRGGLGEMSSQAVRREWARALARAGLTG
jgi:ribonuclease P protein component